MYTERWDTGEVITSEEPESNPDRATTTSLEDTDREVGQSAPANPTYDEGAGLREAQNNESVCPTRTTAPPICMVSALESPLERGGRELLCWNHR